MLGFLKKKKKKKDDVITEATGPVDASGSEDEQGVVIEDSQSDDQQNSDNNSSDDNQSAGGSGDAMTQAAIQGMLGGGGGGSIKEMLKSIDTSGMSLKEKMGLKMLQKLPEKKQEELLRQALNPQELYKHKDMVLKQIDEMVKAGQIQKGQAEAVKAQMGLR